MADKYEFVGKWITTDEFCALSPRSVFHKQLEPMEIDCTEHRNRHILFRKKFNIEKTLGTKIFITADDCYALYINGRFVCRGPAPGYHFLYNYNEIDISDYLTEGENTLAAHTLYQGLINRVWQSGDLRHGLIFDIVSDGRVAACSDESVRTAYHSGYTEIGTVGYDTGFLEEYNANAKEVGFEAIGYDDSAWEMAKILTTNDHTLIPQRTSGLTEERILPCSARRDGDRVIYDFDGIYVGYLYFKARGRCGDTVTVRMGQELDGEGRVRYNLRANCVYEERFILGEGECELLQFDYKAFGFAELILPPGAEVYDLCLVARHYPFELAVGMGEKFKNDDRFKAIFELCVRSQKYGVQEAVLDCMEREKGFYLGDGCYTALTNMILTGDDVMVRKLIDEAFETAFITDGLVTCLNCSFMQEIAEFPLILIKLILWHYRYTGDTEYLKKNYPRAVALIEAYRRDFERGGLLRDLDKWCVVEWPMNFRDGYDVDIREGQICREAHISINAYYLDAVRALNIMADALGLEKYRDETELRERIISAFYDGEAGLFRDGENTMHKSLIANVFAYSFGLCPDGRSKENILKMIRERGVHSLSLFCTFIALEGLIRERREDLLAEMLSDEGAWLRIIREGGRVTYEGWGKDTKWNTSLFHMTLSYGAIFLSDIDLYSLFK